MPVAAIMMLKLKFAGAPTQVGGLGLGLWRVFAIWSRDKPESELLRHLPKEPGQALRRSQTCSSTGPRGLALTASARLSYPKTTKTSFCL